MPSYARQRSLSPTTIQINPSTPPKTPPKAVAFPSGQSPVTSVSRPLSIPERWTLYYFEAHCRQCEHCRDPYHVHKAHQSLCSEGYRLAQHVAVVVYSKHNAQDVYDAATGRDRDPVKVELPHDYSEVRSLLKAMERSLRHRSQRPIVSFDRAYYYTSDRVKLEAPSRRLSYRQPQATSTVADLKQESPRRTSKSFRATTETSPRRHERRRSMLGDATELSSAPRPHRSSSARRHSSLLPSSLPVAEDTEVRPRRVAAQSSPRHNTSIKATIVTPVAASHEAPLTPDQSPIASDVSSLPSLVHNAPVRSKPHVPAIPPMMSGALQPAAPITPPSTPPRRQTVAPAPDAPRARRTRMLPNDDNRRASWYAGAPYQTELREPKKIVPVEAEKEKEKKGRRYSMFLF